MTALWNWPRSPACTPASSAFYSPRLTPSAGYVLLNRLRDLFGKPRLSEEDALASGKHPARVEFPRSAARWKPFEAFLEQAAAVVTFDFEGVAADARALELVNKTNQFKPERPAGIGSEWQTRLSRDGAVSATIAYQDRFGPLGKIAVLQGRKQREYSRRGNLGDELPRVCAPDRTPMPEGAV
jgi:predicted enzyme involved in methoxymalonyl-ACP biosynthesis